MPYKDDIWDWSGTDVKVVNATVVLEGVSVITAEPSENAIEPLERADVELLLPIQIIGKEEEPTISPLEIVDYDSSSIECAFDVTTQEADEVVRGVLCGTINPPTFENADYRLFHGQGGMDLAFAGLHNNTEYYLRPYALSNLGYKYGDVVMQRTKANPIPNEYQLVEWVGSNNNYITLPYLANYSTELFGVFNMPTPQTSFRCFFGARGPSYTNEFALFHSGVATIRDNYYSDVGESINLGESMYGVDLYVKKVRNVTKITFKNREYSVSHTSPVWSCNYNLNLFSLNESGGSSFLVNAIVKYDLIIQENSNKLFHLFPVKRRSDEIGGLYDIINNVFYPLSFIYGDEIGYSGSIWE